MVRVIEEFDAVRIANASIQFFDAGVQRPGTKFGCIGDIEGETELNEIVKKCEGVDKKKIVKPIRMNNTVNAHIPVGVARDIFGLSNKNLKPGVWAYGALSKGKTFVFTADVVDDFEDVTKLIAFSNCASASGFKIMVENGADEVAQLEFEFNAFPDDENQIYYEAFIDEIEDTTVIDQWHTQFTPALVKATTPTP